MFSKNQPPGGGQRGHRKQICAFQKENSHFFKLPFKSTHLAALPQSAWVMRERLYVFHQHLIFFSAKKTNVVLFKKLQIKRVLFLAFINNVSICTHPQCARPVNKTELTAAVKYLQVTKSQEQNSVLGSFNTPQDSWARGGSEMNQVFMGHGYGRQSLF